MDCADEYELMPPENTMEALEAMIRQNLKITYYTDGLDPDDPTVVPVAPTPEPVPTNTPSDAAKVLDEDLEPTPTNEPEPSPTPIPERQLWDEGSHIPAEDLEITVTDPKLFRKMSSFDAKVTYKGLYNRTLDKTIKVTVLDPNAPINDSFIMHIENFGDVTVTYPTSISYHGDEWDKVKTLVKLTCDKTKISAKKVTSTDITKAKSGDTVTIKKIKTKVFTNKNGINQKEAKKLTKKVNKKLKSHLPKTFVIRQLIVMPEYDPQIDRLEGRMPSVISFRVPDIGIVKIKSDSFTVDKENKIVTFTGNYGGYVTFDELGKSERIR